MKIIYIAGKYSGDIDANIQAAREVAEQLWAAGDAVICPHTNTAHFVQATYEQYLRGDLLILSRCDAIVMLPGWEESNGARGELRFACLHNIPAYLWPSMKALNYAAVDGPPLFEGMAK